MKTRVLIWAVIGLFLSGLPAIGQDVAMASARSQQTNRQNQQALIDVLKNLEKQHHVVFDYNRRELKDKFVAPVTNASGSLERTLQTLLAPFNLVVEKNNPHSYLIYNRDRKRPETKSTGDTKTAEPPTSSGTNSETQPQPSFSSAVSPTGSSPIQERTISGNVTDVARNESLPGVSIIQKGTNHGTTTDKDGAFRMQVPNEDVVLVFSYVGYEKQEVAVRSQSTLTVRLKADEKSLEEVVVVGYGTVKKSDLTGSVAKVGEANIKATPIASLDRAMQGRAAGVQVVTNSARPGGSSTIRIRGSGSVNASNDPLYVIDGFPTGNLNSINTDDIESIEVLKDASATAIYGSRGSNGVVLVTTKRGKTGKAVVSYDGYYGSQTPRYLIPLLNARQFAELVDEAQTNNGGKPYFDGSSADRPLASTLGEGTDWQRTVLRNAPIQSHQLSVAGGSATARYAISAGYFNQDGIIPRSNFKRYTLRTNLDNELSSRVKIGMTIQGAYTINNGPRTETAGNRAVDGVIASAFNFSPTFPIYNADGTYYKNVGVLNGLGADNPVAMINEFTDQTSLIRLLANTYLDVKIVEGLTFRTSLGADLQTSKNNFYITRLATLGASLGGSGSVSSTQSINWLNENTLNFSRQLGTDHTVNAVVGYTFQGINSESVDANANTFANDFALYNNLGSGSTLVAPSTGASQWRLISYLARVNYSFKDRFLFTLTGRRDGSSRFGPANKFGFFPSGAFAWKLANEPWMQNLPGVSDAKIRVSYGLSGNQEIGNYQYLANIASAPYVIGGALQVGAATGGIGNPDLRWEKNAQFDVGFDVGLFNNRLQVSADYYNKLTSDLLFSVSVPTSSGFANTLKNIGSVRNTGFELSLNTINVDQGGFRWTSEFNISFNRNKILTLDGRQEFRTGSDATISNTGQNPILLRVGSPLGNFYGLVTDGIFQSQAEVDASAQKTAKPGDLRYKDINGDGSISDLDRDIIGNANPNFFGGFNNTFSYKGIDLNLFFQGSSGNEIINYATFDLINLTGGNNQSARVLERWTPTKGGNTIPRANAAGGSRLLSSLHVEDGSYLRLKNISLGYTLPLRWVSRAGFSSVKVYVAAQNYLTFTKYTGYDPEVNRYGSSSLSQGIDYGGYPAAKTLLIGLNLKL
ncbi:SusC/RagA family TonB-linked outer membrane protein [Larkinella rosea]|nr:TonB-dependent receptor [Larkinella rosea]